MNLLFTTGDFRNRPLAQNPQSDFGKILSACVNNKLNSTNIDWYDEKSICIVLCSKGYPDKYKNFIEIHNLDKINLNKNNVLI